MRHDQYQAMYDLEDRFWWYRGMRSVTASLLDNYLDQREPITMLDVGCGTGYSMAWLRRRYRIRRAYGIDVSPAAAEFWPSRGVDTAAIASASELPFVDGQFDLVTCFDVTYQFTHERCAMTLSEIRRVLRPGGLFFIREPAYKWMRGSHDIAVATAHRYTRKELKAALAAAGYSLLRSSYANSLMFWAAIPHRLISRITAREDSDVRAISGWLDTAFGSALAIEARLLRRIAFPFGLSVVALSRRP